MPEIANACYVAETKASKSVWFDNERMNLSQTPLLQTQQTQPAIMKNAAQAVS